MAGGTGNEMLGDGMLGGSMLGGGPSSGGAGGAGGGMVGDWFVGEDMLGGGPSGSGDSGGGGGGGAVGYGGRAEGSSTATGSIDTVLVLPAEGFPGGDSAVTGMLSLPVWTASGASAGETSFDSTSHVTYSPNLRIGDPASPPLQEQFDARPDFPHADGDHWFYDHWFAEHGNAATHAWGDSSGAVDVQGGRGRIFARGYNSPNAYARVMARTQELGDIDLTFDHEWTTGFASKYEFWFHTDGTWSARSASGRPRNGYRVTFHSEIVRLYRVVSDGNTLLGEIARSYVYEDLERVRLQTVGSRVRLKVWDGLSPEPGWGLDVEGAGRGFGYLQWLTTISYGGGSWGSPGYWSRAFLDNISIERVDQPLLGNIDGSSSVVGGLSLPTTFQPEEIGCSSEVAGELDAHLSPDSPSGDADVVAALGVERAVEAEISGSSSVVADLYALNYQGQADGSTEVTVTPTVDYALSAEPSGSTWVNVNLTFWRELDVDPVVGVAEMFVFADVYILSTPPIECDSEVAAHLWFVDGIVRTEAQADGTATVSGAVTGFFSVKVESSNGETSFPEALLTYWKPMLPVTAQGSSTVVGDFEIYTIPPDPIECSSEVETNLEGDWKYTVDIFGDSSLAMTMEVDTYFLPGISDGSATVTEFGFTIRPQDLDVDSIQGSTSFMQVGSGYLELNLAYDLSGRTTNHLTVNQDDHPYTGTAFLKAVLGMPVVIGLYQTNRSEGVSEVLANLFVNEGGQVNCNSRVDALLNLLTEIYLTGETTGRSPYYLYFPVPEYWQPQPTQEVLDYAAAQFGGQWADITTSNDVQTLRVRDGHVPCGTTFLWADFWRHGDLAPQISAGSSGLGTYYERGKNTHPLTSPTNDRQFSGTYQSWNRPAGWFVDSHYYSFNYMGLFASTSTEEDQYTMPPSWPTWHPEWTSRYNTTPYYDQIRSDIRSGILYHEPMTDDHPGFFHGICGTRFISTLDGSNSIDMDLELKNAMWGLIEGSSEVVGNFIVLLFRTMTVLGNVARSDDRVLLVEGSAAKSPDARLPLRQRHARELEKVRSGNTLYT